MSACFSVSLSSLFSSPVHPAPVIISHHYGVISKCLILDLKLFLMWFHLTNPPLLSMTCHTYPPTLVRSSSAPLKNTLCFFPPLFCHTYIMSHTEPSYRAKGAGQRPAQGMINNLGGRFPNLSSTSTRRKTGITSRIEFGKYMGT